jgi:hypothetical protein
LHQLSAKSPTPRPLQEKSFTANCDTRFAVKLMQLKDCLANQEALIGAVSDVRRWEAASSGSVSAAKMHKLCVGNGTTFWRRGAQVVRLVQPVTDLIHQLESDKPLASQVQPAWDALEAHFEQWHTDCQDPALKADKVSYTRVGRVWTMLALVSAERREANKHCIHSNQHTLSR